MRSVQSVHHLTPHYLRLLRSTCCALALLAGGVTASDAQQTIARTGKGSPTAETSSVERTLFALEEEWTRALVRRDGATFDRLLAPRFVYTENEQVMTKEELIRAVVTGPDTVESAGNEDMRAYGRRWLPQEAAETVAV